MHASEINFISGMDNLKISPDIDITSLTLDMYLFGTSCMMRLPSSINMSNVNFDFKSLISDVISGTV